MSNAKEKLSAVRDSTSDKTHRNQPTANSPPSDSINVANDHQDDVQPLPLEESEEARIERLGRARPPAFASLFSEIAFLFSITMSQIITEFFVSGFGVILPTLITDLDIPRASSVWPASAFSLVIASTLLVLGRLSDMYGGYPIYLAGLTWFIIWSVVAGFSVSPLMLDICRAMQGLGAAAYLPAGTMLLGKVYRPGPRKNIAFSVYGTCAVVGFFVGIFVAGVVGQYLKWHWYFWIGSLVTAATLLTSIFSIPNDYNIKAGNDVQMDWWGAITMVGGLILVIFALTESPHAPQGWKTPYIPVLFVVGILLLCAAAYVEAKVAAQPLLPPSIFKIKSMAPLTISLLFLYGTAGIYLVYGTQYFQTIMHASPLQVVAWYTPTVIGGLTISTLVGFILHLVPGRIFLVISGLGALGSQLLLALIPVGGSNLYWRWVLPAMILCTVGIDTGFNVTTVFITTQLPSAQQGLAGGLINSILQLGLSFTLAFADIAQTSVERKSNLREGFKATFWLGVGVGSSALILMTVWGGIPMAKSDLTADEKRELALEAERELQASKALNTPEAVPA